MKKFLFFLICTLLLLAGCGSSNLSEADGSGKLPEESPNPSGKEDSGEEQNPSLEAVMEEMLSVAKNLPELLLAHPGVENPEYYFACLSAADYGLVEDYRYESSTDTSNPAPELAIIKVKEEGDVNVMEESLREHVNSRLSMFQNYPDQLDKRQIPMVEKAEVFSKGNYVVLIIAENAKDIKKTFLKAVE